MNIKGINGLTIAQLQEEITKGGKFLTYRYCFSLLAITFKRPSAVYFVRGNENAFVKGMPFSIVSLLLGWWGIPWGPFHTLSCLFQNINGGTDVTDEIMQHLQQSTKGYVFEFEQQATFAY